MSEAVLNIALTLLGEAESTGPDDQSAWVQRCRNQLARVIDSALEDYPWNFCEEVVQLSPAADPPLDWEYRFPLPAKCRRVNGVADRIEGRQGRPDTRDNINYRVRKNHILANCDTVYLWFNDGDVGERSGTWSQKFRNLIGAEIANIVYPVTDASDSTRNRIEMALKAARLDARLHDSVQNPPSRVYRHGTAVRARYGGGSSRYRGNDR